MRCKSKARKVTPNEEEETCDLATTTTITDRPLSDPLTSEGSEGDDEDDGDDEEEDPGASLLTNEARRVRSPHMDSETSDKCTPTHPALCLLQDSVLPDQVELRESQAHGLGVWAKVRLPSANQFGPFLGRLRSTPLSTSYAWQVSDATGKIAGWIDASEPGVGNWMKYVRTAHSTHLSNVKAALVKGQVYYQVVKDIEAGEELLLNERSPLFVELCDQVAVSESDDNNKIDGAGPGDQSTLVSRSASTNNSSSTFAFDSSLGDPLLHHFDFAHHSELSDNNFAFSQDSSSPEPPRVEPTGSSGSNTAATRGTGLYKCVACEQSFADVLRLDEHMLIEHYGQESHIVGEYKCDQCPKVFSWKSNLIRHQAAHEEGRRYVCENCHKVFTDPSNLQRHIRSQHIGARSHACPECGKTFATSSGLKQHTHIHSSVKPFQCEVCLKAYTQFSNLCRHKRMHADCRMQIKCHKCGQAFSTVTSLSKHKRFCEGGSLTTATTTSTSNPNSNSLLTYAAAIASSSCHDAHLTNSLSTSNSLTRTMSVGPQSTNQAALMFYPRPGFPFYHPSLVAYPMFSGAALPPPPSLLGTSPLNSVLPTKKPDSPDSSVVNGVAMLRGSNGSNNNSKDALKPRGSEGSESEISDDVSSAAGSDDVDISTASDLDSESDADPRGSSKNNAARALLKAMASSGPEVGASPPPRESTSPKQAAVYPEIKDSISANGILRALTVSCPQEDMPFDLSVGGGKNMVNLHMSPAGKPPDAQNKDEDQPLDLRVDHKKGHQSDHHSPTPPSHHHHHRKTHIFGVGEKNRHKEATTASLTNATEQRTQVSIAPINVTNDIMAPAMSPSKFQMAYPRPIHPLLLAAATEHQNLYKPKYPPAFPSAIPFPPTRYPPLVSPLMNGGASAFDLIRSQMEKMGKPYQDVLAPHTAKLKERYSCKFCGKIFPRSANLTRHLRTHTGEQPYKCKYCERSFSISSNLQRHVRNIHNKEKPFKCPLCERCFGQQTNLDRHLKKHEADGPTILDDDSPKSSDLNDKDDAYFDEIRNFIGKVTDTCTPSPPSALGRATPDRKLTPLVNGAASPTSRGQETPPVKRQRRESNNESEMEANEGGKMSPRESQSPVSYEVMMHFNKKGIDGASADGKELRKSVAISV